MKTTTMTGSIGTSRTIFISSPSPGARGRAGLERLLSARPERLSSSWCSGPVDFVTSRNPRHCSLVVEKLAFVYSRPGRSWIAVLVGDLLVILHDINDHLKRIASHLADRRRVARVHPAVVHRRAALRIAVDGEDDHVVGSADLARSDWPSAGRTRLAAGGRRWRRRRRLDPDGPAAHSPCRRAPAPDAIPSGPRRRS